MAKFLRIFSSFIYGGPPIYGSLCMKQVAKNSWSWFDWHNFCSIMKYVVSFVLHFTCLFLCLQVNEAEPPVMWLSGLHIPESYLTALVQATCRKNGWPLDKSTLYTSVTSYQTPEDVNERAHQGLSYHYVLVSDKVDFITLLLITFHWLIETMLDHVTVVFSYTTAIVLNLNIYSGFKG